MKTPSLLSVGEIAVEEAVRIGGVVAAAERQVDGDDVVLGLMGDDPLEALVDGGPAAVGVGVEDLEGDEVGRRGRRRGTGCWSRRSRRRCSVPWPLSSIGSLSLLTKS